jgi:hypothetical protein
MVGCWNWDTGKAYRVRDCIEQECPFLNVPDPEEECKGCGCAVAAIDCDLCIDMRDIPPC